MTGIHVSRRTFLAGAAGAAALIGTGTLAGCGGSSNQGNSSTANASVKLPTYIRYGGVKPDLPGTDAGVDPAFRHFPATRPKSVPQKPGTGETVTGMANIFYAIPPGRDRNSYWAGLNDRLGLTLDLQMVSAADWATKFPTVIAGNELPDLLQMLMVANYPALLEKRFTRLDDFLSGDAIKDYPNLANIPTSAWKQTVYNGGIYGIPIPRGRIGNYNFIRLDLFKAAGVSPEPKTYEELVETTKALTDPKKRRWALALPVQARQLLGRVNGEPNVWREEGGKFTHAYETEEFKQTANDLVAMWKSGVIHPDAFNPSQPFKQLFNAGTVAMDAWGGYTGWTQYILDNQNNPGFELGLMPTYTRDGSKLAHWTYGSGFYSMTGLKKQDSPDKTKLMLRVLNYLAAPFGTDEYLYRLYGQEGVDHNINADGDPVLTAKGTTNTVLPIRYMADAPGVLYQAGRPQDADTQHAWQSREIHTCVDNPALGLFSNTYASKNTPVDKTFQDGLNQIIQGRQPVSSLDTLISAWRQGAGDGMRHDYEDQLQKAGGR
jgi:putative aldouronate transport system substrate-binding protein